MKNYFTNIIEYLFIIFIILHCNSVYCCAIQNYYILEFSILFSILLLIIKINKFHIAKTSFKKYFSIIGFYCILVMIFVIINVSHEKIISFIVRYLVFFPVNIIIFALYKKENKITVLLRKFVNIVTFLSLSGIFFWLFGSTLKIIKPTGSILANWGGEYNYPSFYGLYFERQYTQYNIFISERRNIGIFTEAPMFNLVLCLALMCNTLLNFKKKDNNQNNRSKITLSKNSIIIIFGIFTTISTTGFIFILLDFIYIYALNTNRNKNYIIRFLLGLFIIFLFSFIIYNLIILKTSTRSYVVRMDDYIAGFKAWMVNPLFGNGYGNNSVFKSFALTDSDRKGGGSNSISIVLSQGGIVLLLFYLLPGILMFFSKKGNNRRQIKMVISLLAYLFITTIFPYRLISFSILSIMWAYLLS